MAAELGPHEPDAARRFDMRALWRLTGWGVAAALSLGALALTVQTDTGGQRLKLAFAPTDLPVRPVAVVQVPPPSGKAELARLKTEVRALTADRARLTERVAVLEHSLGDLTGSIKRQAEAKPAAQTVAAEVAKPAPPLPAIAAPPVTAPPTAVSAEPKLAPAPSPRQKIADRVAPEPAEPAAPAPPQPAASPAQHAPVQVTVPLPPVRMAALPPKPEFGIALAGASSVALLHMQWAALRANFAPLLGDLKPHMLREKRGAATHYRLIVGPMPTYTAAAKLCARLIRARAVCHPVKMAGEPL